MKPIYLEEPSRCPGGIVIHIYSVVTGELMLEQKLLDPEMSELYAYSGMHAIQEDVRGSEGLVLIGFDGDTGEQLGGAAFFGP